MKIFAVLAALTVFTFAFTSCDELLNAIKDEISTEKKGDKDTEDTDNKGDKDKDTEGKIAVSVVYLEFEELDESTRKDVQKSWNALTDEEKAEYDNDILNYDDLLFDLTLKKNRYQAGKTYYLTPAEVKDKFPSNFYEGYYTKYVGYNKSENVEWDGKSKVDSLKVLYSTWRTNWITSEDDEQRIYFYSSPTSEEYYVYLVSKGGLSDWYYSGVYGDYEFYKDRAGTQKTECYDDTVSVLYAIRPAKENFSVVINGKRLYDEENYDDIKLTLKEIKERYPVSEGWRYLQMDRYSEKMDYYEWDEYTEPVYIYDKDTDPYGDW